MKKKIRSWLFILLLQLTWIPLYIFGPEVKTEEVYPTEVIEEQGEMIRWKQEDTYEDALDVSVEPLGLDETNEPQLKSLGIFRITAYCPCKEVCSGNWGTQTSTGAVATEGRTVAVDPDVIPYETVLIINGQEYVAEDCGAGIQDNDIDIYFESHEEADKLGVQYMEVFIWQ